jgi:hypothetical protein
MGLADFLGTNKLQIAAARLTPHSVLAGRHRRLAEPGSARS